MNSVTTALYDLLLETQYVELGDWAAAVARKTGLTRSQARKIVVSNRARSVRTINKNGMSIVPLNAKGDPAIGGRGDKATALKRVDETDDAQFIRYLRHLSESAGGLMQRTRDDGLAAARRQQLSAGSAAVALSAVAGTPVHRQVLRLAAPKTEAGEPEPIRPPRKTKAA